MGREPLLGEEEYSPAPLLSGTARERRQRPLHYGLYAASLVTLCAALYLFIEGLVLLNHADAQSSWRPGSNVWGSIVEAFGILLLWPGILGLIGCVLRHPVCQGAFTGATFIVLHVEITMASIYMRNKDMIRALAPLDLTGGMTSTIQFLDDHPSTATFLAGVFLAFQVVAVAGGFARGMLLLHA